MKLKRKCMILPELFLDEFNDAVSYGGYTNSDFDKWLGVWMSDKDHDAYGGNDCYDQYLLAMNEFRWILNFLK